MRVILENAMQKPHPDPGEYVPINLRLFIQVNAAGMLSDMSNWEIIEEAIEDWLRKKSPRHCGEPEFAGYQWKGLFLPHGTVLRTVFSGKQHHCHVENDLIMFEGRALSPSGFVSAVGGVRRNAWKSVWVLLPGVKHWQRADAMRVRTRPGGARTTAHAARPRSAPPAVVEDVFDAPPSSIQRRQAEAEAEAAPTIAGWTKKRRPRILFAGGVRRLMALLQQELLPLNRRSSI
jgi:hypothetical protein